MLLNSKLFQDRHHYKRQNFTDLLARNRPRIAQDDIFDGETSRKSFKTREREAKKTKLWCMSSTLLLKRGLAPKDIFFLPYFWTCVVQMLCSSLLRLLRECWGENISWETSFDERERKEESEWVRVGDIYDQNWMKNFGFENIIWCVCRRVFK